jgi:hypothetical protein
LAHLGWLCLSSLCATKPYTAKALATQVNYITNPAWDHSKAYALNIDNIVPDVKEMFAAQ